MYTVFVSWKQDTPCSPSHKYPANAECSKPKVTHLLGSLLSSETWGWSPMHLIKAGCWCCELSPPALCGTRIPRAVLLCHTMPQTGFPPGEGRSGGKRLSDGDLQRCRSQPLPGCAGPGSRQAERHVFTVNAEADLYKQAGPCTGVATVIEPWFAQICVADLR